MGNTPNIRFKGFTDDWEQRKWIDTVDISTEMVDPTTGEYDDMPHIAPGNIEPFTGRILDNVKTVKEEQLISGKFRFRPNDVVYGKINPQLGKYFYASIDGLTSADAYVFNGKNGITQKFLYSVLQTKDFFKYSISVSKRSGMPKINRDELNAYSFCVPKEEEQEKIGDFLLGIDNLITLHQRKCDETKKLKKFMLQKMFPKKDANKPEIRFAGFTDDWEQRKLGEIITEYKETVDSDCTLPILTSSKTEGVILQEEHFGRKQQHDITGYNILPRNYCTYRNRSDGVDFTFNINICCDKGIISKFYPVFSGKNSDVFFLSLVLNNSEEVVHEIAYTCTGTGQKVLSFLDLQKMKVRVPNFDEQKEIAAYFESLDHLITLHRRAYYNKKGGLTNVHNDNQQHYAIL